MICSSDYAILLQSSCMSCRCFSAHSKHFLACSFCKKGRLIASHFRIWWLFEGGQAEKDFLKNVKI